MNVFFDKCLKQSESETTENVKFNVPILQVMHPPMSLSENSYQNVAYYCAPLFRQKQYFDANIVRNLGLFCPDNDMPHYA